jgi:TolB-like protein/Tfp pilus assembly protein PilF
MNKFFKELRRRNVVRVAGVYAVAGWGLVQVATTLEDSMNLPAWFDGLVVALLLIGLPVALILAWAFELTPDGVVRTEDVPEGQSVTADTGRKLDYAIIAGIAILAVIILVTRTDQGATEEDVTPVAETVEPESTDVTPNAPLDALLEKSIAVLPFENRSPNADDAFFAAGVHDDLLTHLSKIGDMHVISRTSVMGFAGSERKIPDIGRELGVATVMEGAVQRAGNRVRINVQLIDVATDNHIWAEIYDRELTADNIFDIQSEITKAIASALNTALSDADEAELASRPTQHLAAYDAFVTGKLQTVLFTSSFDLGKAIASFNTAIDNDPAFGEAYALRAYAEIAMHWYTSEAGDWVAAAGESLRKAARLAPNAIETHTARGYYHYWGHLDYVAADAEFELALEKSPNYPLAIAGKAFAARRAGRFEEALTLLEMGTRLDPLNVDIRGSLIETLAVLGRFDEAEAALARAEQVLGEDSLLDPSYLVELRLRQGDAERAWQRVENFDKIFSANAQVQRLDCALILRDPEKMRLALEQWPEETRSPGHAPEVYNIARGQVMLGLGETEAARALFEEIKARIDSSEVPYPSGWRANSLYFPVELPGYVGDLDGVRNAIAESEDSRPPDAWAETEYLRYYATALLWAGAPEEALDYVDQIVEARGPYIYPRLSIEPAFDKVRDHPRFLKLKADYETWAAN